MNMLTIAGLLITLPAIAVIAFALIWGNPWWTLGAVASLFVNSLPFVAAYLLLRAAKRRGQTFEADH
jgi:ABC-type bacteriocin/lantibiotic exporter with double-glycine peptidase domain